MVVTDPDAHPYARASMILVPIDTPGFNLIRPVPVMGHDQRARATARSATRTAACRRPTCSATAAPAS